MRWNVTMRWSTLLVILLLVSTTVADGGVYVVYSYGEDKLNLIPEDRQYAYISREGGVEELRIAVKTKLNGSQAFWILPVPAEAKKVEVDVLDDFPKLRGYEVKSRTGYIVNKAYPFLIFTQIYPVAFTPFIWLPSIFSMGGGGSVETGELRDSGVRVETHVEKRGLTVEALEADSWSALDNYLQGKGVKLPSESRTIIGDYIGKKYSFVVTWISDVSEYKKSAAGGTLSLKTKFPTDNLYYPLKLTAVYGRNIIPVNIYVKDFVQPQVYDAIRDETTVGYYVNEDGMRYTKIKVNAYAQDFRDDLWMKEGAPQDVVVAYVLSYNSILTVVLLHLLCSVISGVLAGLIVYRRKYRVLDYMKVGAFNLATIIGVAYAATRFLKTEQEEGLEKLRRLGGWFWKRKVMLTAVLGILLLLFIIYLFEMLYAPLGNFSYGSNLMNALSFIFIVLTVLYIPIVLTLIAIGVVFLIGLALLKLLKPSNKAIAYCIVFSIIYIIAVSAVSHAVTSYYPPETDYYGWGITGFPKIKPHLSTLTMTTEGDFTCQFVNGAGTTIKVKNVELENRDGSYCTVSPAVTVSEINNFRVDAEGCGEGEAGSPYELTVTIEYDMINYITINGTAFPQATPHTDVGRINGLYESPDARSYYHSSYFDSVPSSRTFTSSGFAKLKPDFMTLMMATNGAFTCQFTNDAGTKIKVKNVKLENQDGSYCTGVITSETALAGGKFRVDAEGCGEGETGSPYELTVTIEYEITVDGVTTTHTDHGLISGTYESQ